MNYQFDEIVDRRNTNCIKYDFNEKFGKPEGLIPLWVADMDFRSPPAVSEALEKISRRGLFCYTDLPKSYYEAMRNWFGTRFQWEIDNEWHLTTPGVVHALSTAINALTEQGDSVMIQQPVYAPFAHVVECNQRKLVNNELLYQDGIYRIDFEAFERQIIENRVKLFLLCSPHNPVGRVWTKEELCRMGDICLKHHVAVASDEIHSDFIFPGHQHHIFANLKPEYKDISVVCTAPSKTFNLAGLQTSNIFIPNPEIRVKFRAVLDRSHIEAPNIFGITACQTAYESGAEWLDQLIAYLKGNVDFLREFLSENLPEIKMIEPEGTYLLWLDCNGLPVPPEKLEGFFVDQAKVWLNDGAVFGESGKGFQRVNIACPRSVLKQAFEQITNAVKCCR